MIKGFWAFTESKLCVKYFESYVRSPLSTLRRPSTIDLFLKSSESFSSPKKEGEDSISLLATLDAGDYSPSKWG